MDVQKLQDLIAAKAGADGRGYDRDEFDSS